MFRITKILCPIDFSARSQVALPLACSLARSYGAALVLLHVRAVPVPVVGEFGAVVSVPLEPTEPLATRLQQCVPADYHGSVAICIGQGDAAEGILATAREENCDLIVLGTHGRSGISRLVLGSVAEAVLREAPCPVMTIKAPQGEPNAQAPAFGRSTAPTVQWDDLITVCTAANAVEAAMIQNALNAEGISCGSEGMNQAGLAGTLGVSIKISVRAGDFDRASKFLQKRKASCPAESVSRR